MKPDWEERLFYFFMALGIVAVIGFVATFEIGIHQIRN